VVEHVARLPGGGGSSWLQAVRARPGRYVTRGLIFAAIAFLVLWVVVIAEPPPAIGGATWRSTTYGSAIDNPRGFLITLLDSVTIAGLYFVVASGFTLIFGLMRVVNMAHGSFFLLGGYIALEVQRRMVGGTASGALGGGIDPSQVSWAEWFVPLIVAGLSIGLIGLLVQQVFLRWNQGQDLRQALITIAISVILADLMLSWFGGIAEDIAWPGAIYKFVDLKAFGIQYSEARLFILGFAVFVGLLLWLWLKRTRTGMVIRAGVDDRQMVSALGIPIGVTFAIAFFVGCALAGVGGTIGGSFASLAPNTDGQWLLNSLIVVIIGGMGSLGGAAIGSLLYGLVTNFSAIYLPTTGDNCCTQYSIIFTFALLAAVLAVRPYGLFGRPA